MRNEIQHQWPSPRSAVSRASVVPLGTPLRDARDALCAADVFDIIFAAIGLFLLAPLLAVVVAAIWLDSPGPVLFRQTRTGHNGKTFRIYKFRTMTVLEDGEQVRQATPYDERVTRVGRFLRRTSVDEIPQLLNVLRGEMSLVGPRPHALAHDEYYARKLPTYSQRFRVKPGITGWAQVNGARGETPVLSDMERRIELDLWFVQHRSLGLYLWILVRTILVEFSDKKGAY
jgi:exopolysaccharide biosynthesis polyprenyl glycosylphosphotransferase